MIVKITYKGDGKLEHWNGHDDYYKERELRGVNDFSVSDNSVLIRTIGEEELKENLDIIETIKVFDPRLN